MLCKQNRLGDLIQNPSVNRVCAITFVSDRKPWDANTPVISDVGLSAEHMVVEMIRLWLAPRSRFTSVTTSSSFYLNR
jgi:hypothetical protein